MPEEAAIELQEVVLAFQKAMARAAQATAQVVATTPGMRYGLRQVYTVQRLEVELQVGTEVQRLVRDGRATDQVLVNPRPDPARADRLRFAVEALPPGDALEQPTLIVRALRDGKPLPDDGRVRIGETLEVEATVSSSLGTGLAAVPVWLEILCLTEGPAWMDPAAPDAERWVPITGDLTWTRPRLTDGSGNARFRIPLGPVSPPAPGLDPIVRIRACARIPARPGTSALLSLSEQTPLILTVEPGDSTGDAAAWSSLLLPRDQGPARAETPPADPAHPG